MPTTTQITVNVLLFAQLKDRFHADAVAVALPSGATGQDLMRWFADTCPALTGLVAVSRLAVHCEYVSLDHPLQDHDDVVLIPPVSGG